MKFKASTIAAPRRGRVHTPKIGYLACAVLLAFLTVAQGVRGAMIGFDDLPDMTVVTDQYKSLGVTFTGGEIQSIAFSPGTVMESGITLNELDFPARSPRNVLVDAGGPITGTFSSPMQMVGGYFTYTTQLTLSAFDAAGNLLASVKSAHDMNFGTSWTEYPPNELLTISQVGGISRFELVGALDGGSFTLDDLTFSAVPEASTLIAGFLLMAVLGWEILRGRFKHRAVP